MNGTWNKCTGQWLKESGTSKVVAEYSSPPPYDMLEQGSLGEPICVKTLSSHCSGPFRCISIQHGVLVIVWRLPNKNKALNESFPLPQFHLQLLNLCHYSREKCYSHITIIPFLIRLRQSC